MRIPAPVWLLPMDEQMAMAEALNQAIRAVGSSREMARRLRITHQAVTRWEVCPAHQARAIEKMTGGAVTRYALRPDVFGRWLGDDD